MAGREQPYDPYIPSANGGQGGSGQYEGGNTRTAAIQSVCGTKMSLNEVVHQSRICFRREGWSGRSSEAHWGKELGR